MREVLERGLPLDEEIERWDNSIREFTNEFGHMALYPE